MQVNLKTISGCWDAGLVLDKHTVSSVYLGDDENGHPQFNTTRTPVGEAVFKLKYRQDWSRIAPLALSAVQHAVPTLGSITAVVPVPSSTTRPRQPVEELAKEIARLMNVPLFACLKKTSSAALKNLHTREEKDAVLANAIQVTCPLHGPWNVLLVDDLYHTGASMNAACQALRGCATVGRITAVAMSWR